MFYDIIYLLSPEGWPRPRGVGCCCHPKGAGYFGKYLWYHAKCYAEYHWWQSMSLDAKYYIAYRWQDHESMTSYGKSSAKPWARKTYVTGRASADGRSTTRAFRPGSAASSKYHLRARQRLLATHHCHWIGTARPGLILTSPAPGRGLRLPSLRLRPTPPVPPGPLRTSVPDGDWRSRERRAAGDVGVPCESVLLYVFYVCEAASFVSPYTTTVECRVTSNGHL